MRTKKPILIVLFLCAWSFISYFLLIKQTNTDNNTKYNPNKLNDVRQHRDDILRKLYRLESSIQEENVFHEQLVRKLVNIIRIDNNNINNQENDVANEHQQEIEATKFPNAHDDLNDVNFNKIGLSDKDNEIGQSFNGEDDEQSKLLNQLQQLNKPNVNLKGPVIAVLVFACNRVSVSNCLDDLVKYRSNPHQFPIIVSQVSVINAQA